MDDSRCILIAKRLRALRLKRGISHEKLAKILQEQYSISISKASLLSYENSSPEDGRLGNRRMNVEFLDCLADFYGVSTDYLLGRKEIASPNDDIEAICTQTGLTEENALLLYSSQHLMQDSGASETPSEYQDEFIKAMELEEPDTSNETLLKYYPAEFINYANLVLSAYKKDRLIRRYTDLLFRESKSCQSIASAAKKYDREFIVNDIQCMLSSKIGERIGVHFSSKPLDNFSQWLVDSIFNSGLQTVSKDSKKKK